MASDAPSPTPPSETALELAEIARSLRARLEWLTESGAWGVPRQAPAELVRVAPNVVPPSVTPELEPNAVGAVPAPSVASALSEEPRKLPVLAGEARLAELAEITRSCTLCGLHTERRQAVFARGTGASGIAFVGEGPGEEEDRLGEPFVGPAGQLLDRMIAAMQLGRDDVYICNIVKCRPPRNRKPEPAEMAACMPYLAEQLDIIKPRVIVALGATAVQGLLGTTEGITRLRGQWKLYRGKIPVMPTFHPAYLLRQPQSKREVWKDLQDVLRHLAAAPP